MICSDKLWRLANKEQAGYAAMPFSSLTDPVDLARAEGALEIAWRELEPQIPEHDREHARTRLAYLIASFALVALDEADLVRRAVDQFRNKPR